MKQQGHTANNDMQIWNTLTKWKLSSNKHFKLGMSVGKWHYTVLRHIELQNISEHQEQNAALQDKCL